MNKHHCLRWICGLFLLLGGLGGPVMAADLIYVPVEPCRIADTRATIGAIPADSSVNLLAYGGVGELTGQGGSPGGCPNPKAGSTPVSIAANVTAVGNQASGNGNLVAYPYGSTDPGSSLVNYKQGTNIANSSIIALCEGDTCTYDFDLKSKFSAVPAIVDVQGYFYPKTMKNVITVSAENADYTNPIDAINAIPSTGPDVPSATNPYVIRIGPGTYDLGSNPLIMREWVNIKGTSGREVTTLTGSVVGAVLLGADNAELADLTIKNTGGGINSYAISNNATSPKIRRVRIRVSGGTYNTGIYNTSASPKLSNINVKVSASGGTNATGIANSDSSPSMKEVTIEVDGGTYASVGISNVSNSSPTMNEINIAVDGSGGTNSTGISNDSSSPLMSNVNLKAYGAGYNNGISNYDSSVATIRSSVIEGSTQYGVYNDSESAANISSSTLIGGAASVQGETYTFTCVYVANGNYLELDGNCQPPP